jgi:hypothetical protein
MIDAKVIIGDPSREDCYCCPNLSMMQITVGDSGKVSTFHLCETCLLEFMKVTNKIKRMLEA